MKRIIIKTICNAFAIQAIIASQDGPKLSAEAKEQILTILLGDEHFRLYFSYKEEVEDWLDEKTKNVTCLMNGSGSLFATFDPSDCLDSNAEFFNEDEFDALHMMVGEMYLILK